MNVGSLFSGIGGIDLGLERAGMHVAWQCEADPFCQRVLARHWPDVPCYPDVRQLVANPFMAGDCVDSVDVLAGGFPCQPVSFAGLGRAQADERWLWPEFARIVRLLRPRYVLVENVPGLLARGMGDVLGDLAACGYDAEWDCIPAAALGAPHRRDRVWIVAYPNGEGEHAGAVDAEVARAPESLAHADRSRRTDAARRPGSPARWRPIFGADDARRRAYEWQPEPDVGRVAHGIPHRMDRLRALGNAVVPQVAEWIGRRMMEAA